MKILVAGATGAVGTRLVPRLVARGHDVVGMTRGQHSRLAVHELGATSVVVHSTVNPEKLAHLGEVADFRALLGRR